MFEQGGDVKAQEEDQGHEHNLLPSCITLEPERPYQTGSHDQEENRRTQDPDDACEGPDLPPVLTATDHCKRALPKLVTRVVWRGSKRTQFLSQIESDSAEQERRVGFQICYRAPIGLLPAGEIDQGIEVKGLMTMPPFFEDPEASRPYFVELRKLGERLAREKIPGISMEELSMGMSNDFEVAVEEGATLVRVGTAIFGPRPVK